MPFSTTTFRNDTDSILGQTGQTVTLAAIKVLASTTYNSVGEENLVWTKTTSTLGDLQPLDNSILGTMVVDVGGLKQNAKRILRLSSAITIAEGMRIYEGATVTTSANHWFVARLLPWPGHNELLLTEKGPKE